MTFDVEAARSRDRSQMTRGDMSLAMDAAYGEIVRLRAQVDEREKWYEHVTGSWKAEEEEWIKENERLRAEVEDWKREADIGKWPKEAAQEYHQLKVEVPRLRDQLDDVELALRKLDEGTYGRCEVCGREIGEARLEVMPAARFCIDHAG